MTIGERIKEVRKKLGISQVDFADKINVSKQTLYKYENNIITNIPSDKIEAAAQLGNVSPAYLMGWEDTTSKPIASASITLYNVHCDTKEESELVMNFRELNDTNKKKCSVYVSSLLTNQRMEEELTPTTLAAHFDGDKYTDTEKDEINQFAEFVKNRNK